MQSTMCSQVTSTDVRLSTHLTPKIRFAQPQTLFLFRSVLSHFVMFLVVYCFPEAERITVFFWVSKFLLCVFVILSPSPRSKLETLGR